MKISENGIKLLIENEGFRNKAYLDSKGLPTIGIGHLDREGKETIFIETTMLSGYSLDEAMKQGNEEYMENEGKFDSEKEEDWPYHTANIQDARSVGIIPIKDSSAN